MMASGIQIRGLLLTSPSQECRPPARSLCWPFSIPTRRLVKDGLASEGLQVDVKDLKKTLVVRNNRRRPGHGAVAKLPEVTLDGKQEEAEGLKTIEIHYHRRDGNYNGWGLHVWGDVEYPSAWHNPLPPAGADDFGIYWAVVAKLTGAGAVQFLVHKEENKDVSGSVDASVNNAVWLVAEKSTVFVDEPDLASIPLGNLTLAKAFWVLEDLLAWPAEVEGAEYYLHASKQAGLHLTGKGVEGGGERIKLKIDPLGLPFEVEEKFPHIKGYIPLRLPSGPKVKELVKYQLAVASVGSSGLPIDASGVQLPGVLDDVFAYDGPLGPTFTGHSIQLHLWAPTAQNVRLVLYSSPSGGEPTNVIQMNEQNGVWAVAGSTDWNGLYYLYEITVFHPTTLQIEKSFSNDPYSRGLSANGERSLIVDLSDASTQPEGWENLASQKPELRSFNDIAIYELHIRDFSISDESINAELRGTYLAFAEKKSAGITHLRRLAKAGLSHVHLLPSFDFATVDERKSTWQFVDAERLATLPPDSEDQQLAVETIQDMDGFNWGYDPVNWGVPDGSYSTDPDGVVRILEFRKMVQGLNHAGLRVILDVVYNHLHASGPVDRYSVLDKVVPGYYLRRNKEGAIENSTCVNNTASEHYMVDRLIVDDLLHWAEDYKVDGFRFDLMGHIMKKTMVRAQAALRRLNIEEGGVDGSKIYLYGEGWNFGEVANNARGVNATQHNMSGTGIGSFNDHIRDSAMGGSPFGDPLQQGFLTGLLIEPNDLDQGDELTMAKALADGTDRVCLGLAGNLKGYVLKNSEGVEVEGCDVLTHDGVPVAYAASPEELINYVSAHDNETLFDVIMLKTARSLPLEQKCRINSLASGIVALAQGIPFFHAGDEMLRSKSLDRDSYNSGDWFNKLDFTFETNNFGVGLPLKSKNGSKWPIMRELLANTSLKPNKQHILAAVENFQELLKIRFSSPLFRLATTEDVEARLKFLSCGAAGAIIMSLEDGDEGDEAGLAQLDSNFRRIVVIFNARPTRLEADVTSVKGLHLSLHPVQAVSYDTVVQTSTFDAERGVFDIPPRTAAVFVQAR